MRQPRKPLRPRKLQRPRIFAKRPKPMQLRMSFPQPSRKAPESEPVPYPGLIKDPVEVQAKAEMGFAKFQIDSGRELDQSGRGIETHADEQNVRAFQESIGHPLRRDGDGELPHERWQGFQGGPGSDAQRNLPNVDISSHFPGPIGGFGSEVPMDQMLSPRSEPLMAEPAPNRRELEQPQPPPAHFMVGE